ncbi:MAG TPA: hypothetical protein VFM15_08260 [Gammaproteobacteria bacterium]|nr:hypothetical protein [Gammaproteobacteria bacterium]
MKTFHVSYMLFSVMLLGGCASSGQSRYHVYSGEHLDQVTPAAVAAINNNHPENVLCWRTKPVGSHLLHSFCATKEEVAEQKKRDRDKIFWLENGIAKPSPAGGG